MGEKRAQELFVAAIVVFVYLFVNLTMEFFGKGEMSKWLVELCVGIIATYALANSRLKAKSNGGEIIARPGQYFVYIAWFYILVVGEYCFFSKTEITANIMRAVGEITAVFMGSNFVNVRKGLK